MENKMDISRRGFIGTVAGPARWRPSALPGAPRIVADAAEPMADTAPRAPTPRPTGWASPPRSPRAISSPPRSATCSSSAPATAAWMPRPTRPTKGSTSSSARRARPWAPRATGSRLWARAPWRSGVEVDRQRLMGEIVRYSQGNCDQRLIRMWMDESNDMFEFVDGIMTASGAVVIADEFDMPGGMGGTPTILPLRAPLRRRQRWSRHRGAQRPFREAHQRGREGDLLRPRVGEAGARRGRTGDRRHLQHPGRLCADQRGQGRAAHYGRLCGESRYGDGALSGDRAIGDGARLQPEQHRRRHHAALGRRQAISPRRP